MTKIIRALSKVQEEYTIAYLLKKKVAQRKHNLKMENYNLRVLNFEYKRDTDFKGYKKTWDIVKDNFAKLQGDNKTVNDILWNTYINVTRCEYNESARIVDRLESKEASLHELFNRWSDKEFYMFD